MPAALFLSSLLPSNPPFPISDLFPPSSIRPNAFSSSFCTSPPLQSPLKPRQYRTSSHSRRVSACQSGPHSPSDEPQYNKNPNIPFSETPSLRKMPTAPWMSSPVFLPSEEVLDLSRSPEKKTKPEGVGFGFDRPLTERVRGGRSKQAMRKIVRSIAKIPKIGTVTEKELPEGYKESKFREFRVPLGKVGEDEGRRLGSSVPWARVERTVFRREKRVKVATAAELSLDETELTRLRSEAAKIRTWVKVKKAGVTEDVVEEIRRRWRESELAMVKFDVPLCRNMERAHEILETKSGGLVVWRKNHTLVVYRGSDCQSPSKDYPKLLSGFADGENSPMPQDGHLAVKDASVVGKKEVNLSVNGTLYEREGDRLLDDLGPRFIDWWGPKPLPVDADLLPEIVPGYRPPFRLCPPLTRPKLKDDELTYLRKIARPLPTHFVLGRNSKLQGLASAILKLWEKSLIAKIALKYGIPNTNNEQMAWELKHLTGGVLVLRNKFYIILFRGKDFLPRRVETLISEREEELKNRQLQEENARSKAVESYYVIEKTLSSISTSGTFSEFRDIEAKSDPLKDNIWETRIQIEAEKERLEKELRNQEYKLLILKLKIDKSEKELTKLDSGRRTTEQFADSRWRTAEQFADSGWRTIEHFADQELLTEEEKHTYRNIGLKMDGVLVLGRRGVYDGVIGSIHQHWKHREIVKIITMQRHFSHIMNTARLLEIESGGVLVSVEKLRTGHAILIYRGKNYRRPLKLLPDNLLTKREALQQSIEMQRRGSLKFFANQRQQKIRVLRHKLRSS